MAEKMTTLEDLLIEELRDLYSAETQIIEALPKMAKAASSAKLRDAFEMHLRQSEKHRETVSELVRELGAVPSGVTCKGMQGLIKEGEGMIKENAEPSVKDAGLISAAQRVEHYEMAGYGCVRTWARLLGYDEMADKLQKILDEEGATDQKLTKLAESTINVKAAD